MGDGCYRSKDPTNSINVGLLKEKATKAELASVCPRLLVEVRIIIIIIRTCSALIYNKIGHRTEQTSKRVRVPDQSIITLFNFAVSGKHKVTQK